MTMLTRHDKSGMFESRDGEGRRPGSLRARRLGDGRAADLLGGERLMALQDHDPNTVGCFIAMIFMVLVFIFFICVAVTM
jgi:hypothetical protein